MFSSVNASESPALMVVTQSLSTDTLIAIFYKCQAESLQLQEMELTVARFRQQDAMQINAKTNHSTGWWDASRSEPKAMNKTKNRP